MDLPDLRGLPQQQVQAQPCKVELPAPGPGGTALDALPGQPGIVVLRIIDQPRGTVYLIPMVASYAHELADELRAPNVQRATGNGGAPAA